MKITTKYNYSPKDKTLEVDGVVYKVVSVIDHLEDIMKATTGALAAFTKGEATALDFSAIRPRGSKTSHAGIATGAASFAKAFADLVEVLSNVDDEKRHKPIAIVADNHPDFEEYSNLDSRIVMYLTRSSDWSNVDTTSGEGKPIPNWELSSQELESINDERNRRASPWFKEI